MAHDKPGYLTPEEIQEGIYFCLQNVSDILEDCSLLLGNGRFARPLALSITALEEMGKINVLRSINRLPKNKHKLRSLEWKKYYEHQRKSSLGLFSIVPDENRGSIDSIFSSALYVSEQAGLTEDFRQRALYTSYTTKKKVWFSPKEIDRTLAYQYFDIARKAFERIMRIKELGFYDSDVLRLEQEMYKELYDNLPDKPYDEATFRKIGPVAKAKSRQLFDKLIDMGRIAKSDVSFLD